jgi:RNA recognition motif-containing protein
MDKAALKEFAMSIDGVVNARVPVRQGGHMGYMFLECVNGDAMRRVIAELDGYELSGKALGARPAKSDPIKKKGKEPKATKREKKSKAQLAEEAAEKRILDARAQMEAEALLELERFQRRRERELEAERVKLEAQRALEEERERKARILLEQRTAKAEARVAPNSPQSLEPSSSVRLETWATSSSIRLGGLASSIFATDSTPCASMSTPIPTSTSPRSPRETAPSIKPLKRSPTRHRWP